MITISPLTPESGTIDACGAPRLFATPATVRRCCARVEEVGGLDDRELGLREAAQDRLVRDRRLLGAPGAERAAEAACGGAARAAGRPGAGVPSRSQPYSSAISWQSGQTST